MDRRAFIRCGFIGLLAAPLSARAQLSAECELPFWPSALTAQEMEILVNAYANAG